MDNNNKYFGLVLDSNTFNSMKSSIKKMDGHFGRRGQTTDFIRPAIDKFIEASKENRGLEFIDYIKAFK